MEEYGIEHHKSSPYRPQANEAIEAANKNMKNILAKMVVTYKDWAEKRVRAQYHAQGYQNWIARAFNKKVKPRNLKEGDLVLKVLRDKTFDP